ncbi:hypothetical protein ACFOUP_18565 [Belliella kenyensis]|uniref:Uncharacterized protein n=1 Tax=Belliella kenyensis TaxID=1472724 RepID=A0ABV8EST4_9BACT|nr:hypothetical protein [Belliella kenyensis]MCH7402219.1 hypothetical protein [Belliella kenyensis]MDN3601733.1 hypothetical protein [Belliella kenyensis]
MDIDFSELSFVNGDYPDGISQKEILSVLANENHKLYNIPGFPLKEFYNLACGYSSSKRILLIASRIVEMKRQVIQVKVADENEIESYYCKG